MEQVVFEKFSRLIYETSGITLRPGKESLVSARIGKRMRALGVTTPEAYLRCVEEDSTGAEVVQLLDAVSTNLTSFFREPDHFDQLTQVFRQWTSEGQRRFRFWSAASSTGEEPYTMAMTLLDAAESRDVDVKILGTDICTKVLAHCRNGVYSDERVQKVPPALRHRYFRRHGSKQDGLFEVTPEVKHLVTFRRLNLSMPPFPMKGPFDAVFCRNVMIYFDNEVRRRLLDDIYRLLKPGGYLMVGHSESLMGLKTNYRQVSASVYVK